MRTLDIDLSKIEEFEMTYTFKKTEDEYEYIQDGELKLHPSNENIRFNMKDKDTSEGNESEIFIVNKDSNNAFYIKSDFFIDSSAFFDLEIIEIDDEKACFKHSDNDESLLLTAYFF